MEVRLARTPRPSSLPQAGPSLPHPFLSTTLLDGTWSGPQTSLQSSFLFFFFFPMRSVNQARHKHTPPSPSRSEIPSQRRLPPPPCLPAPTGFLEHMYIVREPQRGAGHLYLYSFKLYTYTYTYTCFYLCACARTHTHISGGQKRAQEPLELE